MVKNDSLWLKTLKLIPNGCQTLSKRPETYVNGVYPKFITHGHGCEVFDEHDNPYIDYISSLGAILKGHNDMQVDDAVIQTIRGGQVLHSLPHAKEYELAQKLCAISSLDKVKFFKTGSEATSAAVRVARAYTKRDVILKCGYNGWHDWAMYHSSRNEGIPSGVGTDVGTFTYNDMDSVKEAFKVFKSIHNPVAAVILEPCIYEESRDNFLEKLCEFTRKEGAIVIFDEIVTGMRFGLSGASGLFGITPDLSCFGKSLGNGYPISGLIGKDVFMDIFNSDSFIASGTFSGDLVGISAAIAVIETYDPKLIWKSGLSLKMGFNKLCNDFGFKDIKCIGYAPRTKFEFPTVAHRALFWQECVKRGILFGYTNFVTTSHGERIIENTLRVCYEALKLVKNNFNNPKSMLDGELPKVVL